MCRDFLGFQPTNQEAHKQLTGQRILINRLLEQVAGPLPPNAEEDELYKYARCYILALLGDTIFDDKSDNSASNVGTAVGRPSQPRNVQLGKCLPCMVEPRVMQGKQ